MHMDVILGCCSWLSRCRHTHMGVQYSGFIVLLCLQVKNAMFEYGRHLGLAFQIVDDILDFTTATEQLGKPQV